MRIAPILLTIVSMAFVPAGKAASLALDLGGQRFDPLQSQPEFAGGWDQPDADDIVYEEIVITLLHEIGHHFGLDEEDLARLGYD